MDIKGVDLDTSSPEGISREIQMWGTLIRTLGKGLGGQKGGRQGRYTSVHSLRGGTGSQRGRRFLRILAG